jgi:murein DD-endopeptidase MepM/ murein hydrolase activator NlpD
MKLQYPYSKFVKTQGFGQNATSTYKASGLLGHTGLDTSAGFSAKIYACIGGYVHEVSNKENPNPERGRAVKVLYEESGVCYEIGYHHLDHIEVEEGQIIKTGDFIGTEGNTGNVYSSGQYVTKEMRLNGSKAGAHLHLEIKLLKKVEKKESGKTYLKNGVKVDGFYYEVVEFKNGYNGCIDPEQFFIDKGPKEIKVNKITQTLRYGSRGTDVITIQKFLGIKADGIFGTQTDKAVKQFQKDAGLKVDGIVGAITRSVINK